MDVVVATDRWNGPPMLPDGTLVVSALQDISPSERFTIRLMGALLERGWRANQFLERRRYERSVERAGEPPSFVGPISHARALARLVLSLRPAFVFGMEVFQYGLATAMCEGVPRILMPWGGDIYLYPEATAVSFAMVRHALSRVDLVCPTSRTAATYLTSRYGIPARNIRAVSWGVDRSAFQRAAPARRGKVCARFGIDPGSRVILNARRFLPIWGCHTALEACLRYGAEDRGAHFVFLGGVGTEGLVREARRMVRSKGLADRCTMFEGDTPFADCIDLMSVADAYVSLMLVPDMRSASILQAASAGGVPILGDQPEYREMERDGFRAIFVPAGNADAVAAALLESAADKAWTEEIRRGNDRYLAEHEDQSVQMGRLLDAVEEVRGAHGGRKIRREGKGGP